MLHENDLWILSFYRTSEISGALFFGRLAKSLRPGPIQRDLTKHFSDESLHAWYWTECLEKLGARPLRLDRSYQDLYIEAAGLPANIMEILAVTQVFEKRVIGQYSRHSALPGLQPEIRETLRRIMEDEKWHIEWIRDALKALEPEYGADLVQATLRRYGEADREVYARTVDEHAQRLEALFKGRGAGERP
jgi:hypothetical protein